MSVYSASMATTPILKSANTSLNRKKIHERIRNTVQFQLISQNGLRKVLEDASKGINVGAYEDYIRAMHDVDLSDPDFGVLIKESRQCIELLKPHKFTLFVETLICLNWINRNETLIVEYQEFLIDLLSEHNKYTSFALSKLIQFWVPKPIDESFWKNGVPDERIKFFLNYVHQTLGKILDVIPMANDFAIEVIEKLFPYYTKPSYVIAGYMNNMMWMMEYRPMFREDLLQILFKNFVLMDVSVRRSDIEAAERLSQDAEEIFKMDADDVKLQNQEGMQHPIAQTIDICLNKLFEYITAQCQSNPNEDSNKTTLRCSHFFKILMKSFEDYILPTHKTNHIQFVMFYFCSLRTSISESFISYLCSKVWDPNVATTVRQSSVGYIASLLARGKFISQQRIKHTLHDLCRWAHDYVEKSDASQNTQNIKVHLVFYAVCEAIFYVIAFRSRDLTNSSENLTFLQSLQLSTLVTCHLNPLRVCLPAVATTFAGVTRAHQLAYCHTILERNARRKLAMVYQNEIVMPEETLDTTFPFDPYLLKKSGKYIEAVYQQYQPCEDEDPNGVHSQIATNEQRRRKRVESLMSSVDDDDFLSDPKRNKLAEHSKNYEKEILFSYGTSPGFH
ncbi:RNA polymerase I-specific transcription initiation factor RRN3 isoform X2 [Sitodiplosis mosellana]|nr:RNA polymerase I-specific transcription initiation factor RRN3 isoform X2 [Sitodiplosis mosellana]